MMWTVAHRPVHPLDWSVMFGPLHDWHWSLLLPTGWMAAVHDESQVSDPPRPLRYRISAVCDGAVVHRKKTYTDLALAKIAALQLALAQSSKIKS